jgi:ParB-like chromosome segregation protein Spo0J
MAEPKLEQVDLESLIPYARNAKKHSDEQVAQIAASIREFGFNAPVLIDKQNGIIAGHGRVLAARKLGLDKVPCLKLTHLSESQRKAYILADNKIAENGGGWDEELLRLELRELSDELHFDINKVGFSEAELGNLFLEPNFEPGTEEEQGKLDEKSPVICPKCSHEFHP